MNVQNLINTAKALVSEDKGLLAMDESDPTCNKRFAKLGIPQTVEARRAYRELIVTAPGLDECISGAILYDETIRQQKRDGTPFAKALAAAGIIPGIKVDAGAKAMAAHPGEKITEGLDGLRERLAEYFQMGACFAKWRAVIAIGENIPSRSCLEANAHTLARYAALCQEAGLVPIVEPEVLMDGAHTLERCRKVTEENLRNVFIQLNCQRVLLEGMILKSCRRHGELSFADRPRRRAGNCIFIRRPAKRTGLGSSKRDECPVQVANAVGVDVFIFPRHPATGFGNLAGQGRQRESSTTSPNSSCQV
jgi:fructose-bisphosphate aldolase, class I